MPSLDSETQFRCYQGPGDSLGRVAMKEPLGCSCKRLDIDFSPLGMWKSQVPPLTHYLSL